MPPRYFFWGKKEEVSRAKTRMLDKQLRIGTSPMHEEQLRISAYVVLFKILKRSNDIWTDVAEMLRSERRNSMKIL